MKVTLVMSTIMLTTARSAQLNEQSARKPLKNSEHIPRTRAKFFRASPAAAPSGHLSPENRGFRGFCDQSKDSNAEG
jgi:hypothetical protein